MLSFDPGLAIWAIITFVVLLIVLGKAVWPKILSALDERETKIRTSLEEAEKAKVEAERVMAEYKEMIAKARQESAEIMKQGAEQAEKVREELIAKAKEDASKFIENAKKELELEQEKAIQEMKAKTIGISVSIATKIIQDALSQEKQIDLARQALQEMETN